MMNSSTSQEFVNFMELGGIVATTQIGTNNFSFKLCCGDYFLDCSDVTMYDVIVIDGPDTGVIIYDILSTVTIANSQFIVT